MEEIPSIEVHSLNMARTQRLIKKFYRREYTEWEREGYVHDKDHTRYLIDASTATDRDAVHHLKASQAFRESGTFCPLYILLSVLAYRKEIPGGKYLLRVKEE